MRTDVPRVVTARALRGFADGFVSVLLARYLTELGFSPLQIGAIVTGTLVGSAMLTLAVGLSAHHWPVRSLLVGASGLMIATGLGFATVTWFWPLLAIAVVGTLNPSAGDVSVFLPTEQAFLADIVEQPKRPRLYAMYNLAGIIAGAFGALASAAPEPLARTLDIEISTAQRVGFGVYIAVGAVILAIYRQLQNDALMDDTPSDAPPGVGRRQPLGSSRRTILELAALFSLDAASSGFVVQAMLVLWLNLRFDLSVEATAAVFFAVSLLGGASQLLAGPLADRVGLIRTMVFTHLPANTFLALAAFAPRPGIAITLLLLRALCSQMDVPARQSFVMAVVPPAERAAAASITNVPRSLASAATPLLAGLLLAHSDFGWPLLIAGTGKIVYDLLLLALYRNVPEVEGATRRP